MAETDATQRLSITAEWELGIVAAEGGTASLLIRVKPAGPLPGERRAPVDVAVVLDRSGSMAHGKLDLAKTATSTALALLHDEDRAALVVYDNEVDTIHTLQPATARAKAAIRLALHGVDPGGSTNLSGGWLTGCDQLASAMPVSGSERTRLRRALLFTDGQANAGITDPNELIHHAGELRKRGIITTCLGIGDDFDEVLLSGMTEAGGGNFEYAQSADQLPAFFAKELGELLTVAAANVTISVTMPHGVRGTLVNPFPSERHGKTIDIALRDVTGHDEIPLVFDFDVVPGHIGTSNRVVVAASWVDPAADRRMQTEVVPPILARVPGIVVKNAPVNTAVAEEIAEQRAAVMRREAMRLDREGKHAESRARLQEHQAMLAAAPKSARLLGAMSAMEDLVSHDASAPLGESMRKQVTYDAMRRSRGTRQNETPPR